MTARRKFMLLVCDNPDEQALTLRGLRQGGVQDEVVAVHDGDEAIAFLEGTGRYADRNIGRMPSLILLDMTQTHVEGHKTLRRLRGHLKSRLIPIVILMSSFDREDLDAGFGKGANSLVYKSTDARKLSETLGQIGRYWLHINETPG